MTKESFYNKPPQIRLPSTELFTNLYLYVERQIKKHLTKVSTIADTNLLSTERQIIALFAIYFAFHTGLRVGTILSIDNYHLKMLHARETPIPIKMKNSNTWDVSYFPIFNTFIDILYSFFGQYVASSLRIKIFTISRTYLLLYLKKLYMLANDGELPPTGFGIHSVRYHLATELSKTNLQSARKLLNHTHLNTTKKYVLSTNRIFNQRIQEIESSSKLFTTINQLLK